MSYHLSGDHADVSFESAEYRDEVQAIIDGFGYELCHDCGGDLGAHVISPDPLGHAHAWCASAWRD